MRRIAGVAVIVFSLSTVALGDEAGWRTSKSTDLAQLFSGSFGERVFSTLRSSNALELQVFRRNGEMGTLSVWSRLTVIATTSETRISFDIAAAGMSAILDCHDSPKNCFVTISTDSKPATPFRVCFTEQPSTMQRVEFDRPDLILELFASEPELLISADAIVSSASTANGQQTRRLDYRFAVAGLPKPSATSEKHVCDYHGTSGLPEYEFRQVN